MTRSRSMVRPQSVPGVTRRPWWREALEWLCAVVIVVGLILGMSIVGFTPA